ncbi:hypothetical protein G0Q06_02135 [Puniceicoccales bacterium CK1056]|uniref:Cadherin-like domain-containing protein n=1 Tax=Oceanipulchritudo coccoides TaxID=2706888 RepID=A0A6B2M0F5_9BACT|nr:Ig-like domain-containing protein [Oceanipulchritudo coccoides]NDV61245.1 hypothetical protein [Oceanipulchritudo coccoides]
MSALLRNLFACVAIGGLASTGLWAQLTVDDFEDNLKDPALWGTDEGSGSAQLTETNGRLEFTNSDFIGEVEVSRPSQLALPVDSGWIVTVEVANFVVTAFNPQIASLGIAVFPAGDQVREVWIELYSSWTAGGDAVWGYNTQLVKASDPDGYYGADSGNQIPVSEGQLRLIYDSATRIITAEFWPNGEPGWIELATFGVSGSGGNEGNSNWGLGAADTFDLTLWGYADAKSVSAGSIYFESFSVEGTGSGGPELVANNDTATIQKNTEAYEIHAKVNDRSLASALESVTITGVSDSNVGSAVSTNGQVVLYTPPAEFLGTDNLTYTIEDGAGNTDSAEIEVRVVDVAYPGSDSDSGLISAMELAALRYPEWAPYLALYERHIAEILSLTLASDSFSSAKGIVEKSGGFPVQTRSGNSSTQAQLETVFQLLAEPAVAILTGETEDVLVSQELVDEIINLRVYLQDVGSDSLKADLQDLVDGAEDRNAIIGRTVAEQAVVAPGSSLLEAVDPTLLPGAFFAVSSQNVTGLILNLWRYNLETSDGWVQLPTTVRDPNGEKVVLRDPDPVSDPVLYHVRGERDSSGALSR